MELQVGVKILLKNKQGKFLLLLRNPKQYPEAGETWDMVGGRIQSGVGLLDNLKREIKEETGLDYPGAPKLITAQDIILSTNKHIVRLTYEGEIEGEVVVGEEHLEARWFSLAEIKTTPSLDKYLKEMLESYGNK